LNCLHDSLLPLSSGLVVFGKALEWFGDAGPAAGHLRPSFRKRGRADACHQSPDGGTASLSSPIHQILHGAVRGRGFGMSSPILFFQPSSPLAPTARPAVSTINFSGTGEFMFALAVRRW